MRLEFDPEKSARNARERGLPFGAAIRLFDGVRLEWEDRRKDYGEIRINTLGEIEGRVFFATFTRREEGVVRIVSFRKANDREARRFQTFLREHSAGRQD